MGATQECRSSATRMLDFSSEEKLNIQNFYFKSLDFLQVEDYFRLKKKILCVSQCKYAPPSYQFATSGIVAKRKGFRIREL